MTGAVPTAVLLASCPDRQGIVAAVTRFIADRHGNIVALEQHVARDEAAFFMRVEFELDGFAVAPEAFADAFGPVARAFDMSWKLSLAAQRQRMALFVTRESHCVYDILARHQAGEWAVDIPVVVANHDALRPVAERFGIPFHVFPISAETKASQEARELELLRDQRIDFVVLARYMQIVSADFIRHYPNRIVNIHHSFLPAFAGAKPYHAAHERGVKIIGATSHYVTAELDRGPILEQDIIRVSHKDTVEDMIRKGRDNEKVVLARAIRAHIEHRILVHGNRTVVFG
ncbi:MAG: formyltetrahydrofolate deformylase [Verrucomicrobia bacterium A1]|nr:MAG: formyltetrahydrofolate deformylase [Verrucomicrobia bacterium A1]